MAGAKADGQKTHHKVSNARHGLGPIGLAMRDQKPTPCTLRSVAAARGKADGDGVIDHLTNHTQGALGGFVGTASLDRAQHGQAVLGGDGLDGHDAEGRKDVLVELLEPVIAVALGPGASGLGGVPVERNSLKGELCVFAPAWILAAFLGITGIDFVFIEKTFLIIADVTGGPERNPWIGPDAQILPAGSTCGSRPAPSETR
jgi:hypothetical protein